MSQFLAGESAIRREFLRDEAAGSIVEIDVDWRIYLKPGIEPNTWQGQLRKRKKWGKPWKHCGKLERWGDYDSKQEALDNLTRTYEWWQQTGRLAK